MEKMNGLSRIETLWSVVRQAHEGTGDHSNSAQKELLEQYGSAIRRYLLGATRDPQLADELFQEFAFRFLQGQYASANPERGRFRNFLKTILSRLVAEHFRKQQRRKSVPMGSAIAGAADDVANHEDQFDEVWRNDLLRKAWLRLKDYEKQTDRPLHTVMQMRVAKPALSSTELANQVEIELGRPVSPANLRVMLHRARREFAVQLVDEIKETLEQPNTEDIEQELGELRLLKYCRAILESE